MSSTAAVPQQATVSFYNRVKGYGFAVPFDLSADVFVHFGQLPKNHKWVNAGDVIAYELGISRGKPCAMYIRIVSENPTPSMGVQL